MEEKNISLIHNEDSKEKKKSPKVNVPAVVGIVIGLVLIFTAITSIVILALSGGESSEITREETQETEEVVETTEATECTTAPETDTSIPVIEENIPENIPETTPVTNPESNPIDIPVTAPPTEQTNTTPEVTEPPVSTEYSIAPPTNEREMLACVIYQEAGGDATCDDCRRRVGDVVLNRVADSRFPNTMCEVLTAYQQYGRYYWTGLIWPDRAKNQYEQHAVERAYRIADEILAGEHSSLYGNGYIWQAEFIQGTDNIYCCGNYFGR